MLGWFADVKGAARAVGEVVAAGLVPRCMELVDGACLEAMRTEKVAVREGAGAMLLIELDGAQVAVERDMERLGEQASAAGALDLVVAQSDTERSKLWAVRRELSNVVKKLARHKIAEDVVVPRSKLPELIDEVASISAREKLRMFAYGHAGDGNLHINVLWNEDDELGQVEAALSSLMHTVVRLGGALSGEHGIGSSKSKYLPLEQSAELIELERRIKRTLDPKGILNPGKIFPGGPRAG